MLLRNTAKKSAAAWWSAFGKTRPGVWVLLYHVFDRQDLARIEEQLKFLKDHFVCRRASDLVGAIQRQDRTFFESPTAVITIDDGYDCVYSNGAALLDKYGFKPALFIPSDWIGYDGSNASLKALYSAQAHGMMPDGQGRQRSFITQEQLQKLSAAGWEIGGHTASHIDLGMHQVDYHKELGQSRATLGDILGLDISLFAFPHGGYHNIIQAALRAVASSGYACCFSTCGGPNRLSTPLYFLRREVVDPWWTPRMLDGVLKGAFYRRRHYDLPQHWLEGLG